MKYVPDKTGRFAQRPHYQPEELDAECERIITEFMHEKCGGFALPIPTDVLTKLIERDAASLDLYADMAEEGDDVEGVTDFIIGAKPQVRIARELSEQEWREHRFRTTLTHEYGHVKFHDCLYQMEQPTPGLFADAFVRKPLKCKRDGMLSAAAYDWMEWQAGYICGAILMPVSHLKGVVAEYMKQHNLYGPLGTRSADGGTLIATVSEGFHVSEEAARVRLSRLGYLMDGKGGSSLFG